MMWRCRKCKHEVISQTTPETIQWSDGHVCRFTPDTEGELRDMVAYLMAQRAKTLEAMKQAVAALDFGGHSPERRLMEARATLVRAHNAADTRKEAQL